MSQLLIITGRLGRDPEMRYTAEGTAVTNFSVATDRKYTKGGEEVKETTWFRITCWGKLAEACNNYLSKGSLVYVEGRIVPDIATGGPTLFDKKDGTQGSNFEVTASVVQFLITPEKKAENQLPLEDF